MTIFFIILLTIVIGISLYFLYKRIFEFVNRMFLYTRILDLLEHYIDKSFALLMITSIEHAALVGETIDSEIPRLRKIFLNNLYTIMGEKFMRQCILFFGSEEGFLMYVTVRFEENFNVKAVPLLVTSSKKIQPTLNTKIDMLVPKDM